MTPLALVRQLHGGPQSSEVARQSGPAARQILLELAQAIRGAQCYALEVGPLAETADLICDLVSFT